MKILLYNPDNGVNRNFMPHLWMFLLQALTPPGHEVLLIDGNVQAMSDRDLVRFALDRGVGLVGIGAMTRMIAKAYRVADALRAAGIPVVMGGPHVTEVPEEALGRDGGPRHAHAVAVGEADDTWPKIVEDAARGQLRELYAPVDAQGRDRKPSLDDYAEIPWDTLDMKQFNRVPGWMRAIVRRFALSWETFHLIPIETGRGCPYACEFCTVTGFFGDSIRFRSNESVVNEVLRLKARARRTRGTIGVFFVDDNLAINPKRTKSLLRDIIAAGAQIPWVGQISANLLRDEELVELIAASGGKWIFIGMESLDPANLSSVNKGLSKPGEYGAVLERLARRNVYAITSFIFGLDHDAPGVAERTLSQIRNWPPVLPVFGQLTPFPATPLYVRLAKEGRLTRPRHWLDFEPFRMAHAPLRITAEQVQEEIRRAWTESYSAEATRAAIQAIRRQAVGDRIVHLIARLFFRGIYFPQKGTVGWLRAVARYRGTICDLVKEAVARRRDGPHRARPLHIDAPSPEACPPCNAPPGGGS
jgi:radical SAM superfamily enzyme YgiQ (UPF0313 family)